MAPVMDIIATATARAYLAANVVSNAIEFLSSLLDLLPSSPRSDTGVSSRALNPSCIVVAVYACMDRPELHKVV